jgi:hypothetical protein
MNKGVRSSWRGVVSYEAACTATNATSTTDQARRKPSPSSRDTDGKRRLQRPLRRHLKSLVTREPTVDIGQLSPRHLPTVSAPQPTPTHT